jgi:ferritin heavy chain
VRVSKQAGHGLYHLDKELRANNGVVPWASFNDPDKSDELLRGVVADLYKAAV